MALLTPTPKQKFYDNSGNPAARCKLYTYKAGTSIPLESYSDDNKTLNHNPITLDSNGSCDLWLKPEPYCFVLMDSMSANEIWRVDKINVGFKQSDNQSNPRYINSRLNDMIFITDFLPNDFNPNSGITDYTTEVQNAVNAQQISNSLGLYFPPGKYKFGNILLRRGNAIIGAGSSFTNFIPASNNPVFYTDPTNDSAVQLLLQDFSIDGNTSYDHQDGIRLSTTENWFINDVHIYRVKIDGCGQYGIYTFGPYSSSLNGFIQNLRVYDSTIQNCIKSGVSLNGKNIEISFINTFITNNGGSSGIYPNFEVKKYYNNNHNMNVRTNRLRLIGCGLNHVDALPNNNCTILHAENVKDLYIANCDFENGDPHIKLTGIYSRSHVIVGNNFASNYNTSDAILIENCFGLTISNNSFWTSQGQITTNAVTFQPSGNETKLIKQYNIDSTNTFINYTNPINTEKLEITITGGAAWAYRGILYLTTQSSDQPTSLTHIYGPGVNATNGTNDVKTLVHGQIISLLLSDDIHMVKVVDGIGNIMLNNGLDFEMTSTKCQLTLRWDAIMGKWLEISRKYHDHVNYSINNASVDRTYDATNTSIGELADVLGTLIDDLRKKGILG